MSNKDEIKKKVQERKDLVAAALATIPNLVIGDILQHFYDQATPRDHQIADMVETSDDLEVDGAITSEGDDNGAFVLCWTWVSFDGTDLEDEDEKEEEETADAA